MTYKRNNQWFRVGQLVLVIGSCIFLAVALYRNWNMISRAATEFNIATFALAVIILFLAWALLPVPTYITLRALSINISYPQAIAVFCSSQAMKYLPGGLWALPGRAIIYRNYHQLSMLKSSLAVVWETLALLIGAVIVGTTGLVLSQTMFSVEVRISIAVALFLVILIVFLMPTGILWQPLKNSQIYLMVKSANHLEQVAELSSHTSLPSIGSSVLFWLGNGIAFQWLLTSVLGNGNPFSWHEAAGIYALAWVVGFLVIFAPAGLGFRESALVLLLSISIKQGDAVFVAVLARLWWSIAEAIWIVLGVTLYHFTYTLSTSGDNIEIQ